MLQDTQFWTWIWHSHPEFHFQFLAAAWQTIAQPTWSFVWAYVSSAPDLGSFLLAGLFWLSIGCPVTAAVGLFLVLTLAFFCLVALFALVAMILPYLLIAGVISLLILMIAATISFLLSLIKRRFLLLFA